MWTWATAKVRVTSHHNNFAHGQWERDIDCLRKYCSSFREFRFTFLMDVHSIIFDVAGVRSQKSRENFNQSRFACSVWADDQMELRGSK
jgi:hypothetical protein